MIAAVNDNRKDLEQLWVTRRSGTQVDAASHTAWMFCSTPVAEEGAT